MSDNPILNNPYAEPRRHYATNARGELDYADIRAGRRLFTPEMNVIPLKQGPQKDIFEVNDFQGEYGTHFINRVRQEVGQWRADNYQQPAPTRVTRELLDFWFRNPDRHAHYQLFFAQREAIETAIWLNEIADKSNPGQRILRELQDAQQTPLDPPASGGKQIPLDPPACEGRKGGNSASETTLLSPPVNEGKQEIPTACGATPLNPPACSLTPLDPPACGGIEGGETGTEGGIPLLPVPIDDLLYEDTEEDVYDLEVEDTHSFLTEVCAVHNCGSGTTAYVAEQWGRRWITIDTSRIALNIAKTRLMTAVFPYYTLRDEPGGDIRQGFVYKTVPHVTLKSLANDEPPDTETLYDQPQEDRGKLRVAGPFTVETLQNFEPVSPASLDDGSQQTADSSTFEERIFAHLKSAGVKNGLRNEQAVFIRVERLADSFLHAEGFYQSAAGERKAYFHIGPQFGAVSKQAVNEAVKACRARGDADWLIILGFSFESNISNASVTTRLGAFEVTKVRMHDDLMQEGLLKKDKKAASFVTIGEPDVKLHVQNGLATVEICGLDMYDPIKDEVRARNVEDIAYWMLDNDYDGSNFVARQVFFCGGAHDEFDRWRKGLDSLAKETTRKKAQYTLKIELDADAFDHLYGFRSRPFAVQAGQQVAVRVISQFGEESTNVLTVT